MPTASYCRISAYQLFDQQLAQLERSNSLFRAAFAIALHELPEADLAVAETTIENLTETIRKRTKSENPEALLAHLHDVLFDVFNLRGNTDDYYNPANSYLPEVLRSRLGIPITLTLIYKRVAEALGLVVHGINTPGHFMAEVEIGPESSIYVDPFYGGSMLNKNEIAGRIEQSTGSPPPSSLSLTSRATHRQWLARMLNNLQASFAATGRERDVLAMQELQDLLK